MNLFDQNRRKQEELVRKNEEKRREAERAKREKAEVRQRERERELDDQARYDSVGDPSRSFCSLSDRISLMCRVTQLISEPGKCFL